MAKAWRKNNERARRIVAQSALKSAVFTEKVDRKGNPRSEAKWRERVDRELETLAKRI